jgi:predicted HicB family RNase H-like nuclease
MGSESMNVGKDAVASTTTMSIRLSLELKELLQGRANKEMRSLNNLVLMFLRKEMELEEARDELAI